MKLLFVDDDNSRYSSYKQVTKELFGGHIEPKLLDNIDAMIEWLREEENTPDISVFDYILKLTKQNRPVTAKPCIIDGVLGWMIAQKLNPFGVHIIFTSAPEKVREESLEGEILFDYYLRENIRTFGGTESPFEDDLRKTLSSAFIEWQRGMLERNVVSRESWQGKVKLVADEHATDLTLDGFRSLFNKDNGSNNVDFDSFFALQLTEACSDIVLLCKRILDIVRYNYTSTLTKVLSRQFDCPVGAYIHASGLPAHQKEALRFVAEEYLLRLKYEKQLPAHVLNEFLDVVSTASGSPDRANTLYKNKYAADLDESYDLANQQPGVITIYSELISSFASVPSINENRIVLFEVNGVSIRYERAENPFRLSFDKGTVFGAICSIVAEALAKAFPSEHKIADPKINLYWEGERKQYLLRGRLVDVPTCARLYITDNGVGWSTNRPGDGQFSAAMKSLEGWVERIEIASFSITEGKYRVGTLIPKLAIEEVEEFDDNSLIAALEIPDKCSTALVLHFTIKS